MPSIPNVHPHSITEWSSDCAACPVKKPEGYAEVQLDSEIVKRMEKEAGPDVVLTAKPGTEPPKLPPAKS